MFWACLCSSFETKLVMKASRRMKGPLTLLLSLVLRFSGIASNESLTQNEGTAHSSSLSGSTV